MENLDYQTTNHNPTAMHSVQNTHKEKGSAERPEDRKKRILDKRLKNAQIALTRLISTFDQPHYPFQTKDVDVAEELLSDMIADLRCTKASRKIRNEIRVYEI